MPILSSVMSGVPGSVRNKGHNYYLRGTVRVDSGNDFSVVATVAGSMDYRVELRRDDSQVLMACSCPDFLHNS